MLGLGLIKLQRISLSKDTSQKLSELPHEKEFRRRQQFTNDMHIYQLVMIAAILLSLNFVLKLGRQKRECQTQIEQALTGKARAAEGAKPVPVSPTPLAE